MEDDVRCAKFERFTEYLDTQPWDKDSKNHNKANNAFLRGAGLGIAQDKAHDEVVECIHKAGGVVDSADLYAQLRGAYAYIGCKNACTSRPVENAPKLEFLPKRLEAAAGRAAVSDPANFIRRHSPRDPITVTPESFLDALYRPNEHIIVFTDQKGQGDAAFVVGQVQKKLLPKQGSEGVLYLIQPVDGQYRINSDGKRSRRSKESVLRWPYLLLESDEADRELWMQRLVQVPLVIVAIYTSGGRSIHALVRLEAESKQHWDVCKDRIKRVMVPLGADPAAMTAVRLSRLPQCLRGDRMQELLYLNPDADGKPIFQLPERSQSSTMEGNRDAQ